jgi:hypothetical protein
VYERSAQSVEYDGIMREAMIVKSFVGHDHVRRVQILYELPFSWPVLELRLEAVFTLGRRASISNLASRIVEVHSTSNYCHV